METDAKKNQYQYNGKNISSSTTVKIFLNSSELRFKIGCVLFNCGNLFASSEQFWWEFIRACVRACIQILKK